MSKRKGSEQIRRIEKHLKARLLHVRTTKAKLQDVEEARGIVIAENLEKELSDTLDKVRAIDKEVVAEHLERRRKTNQVEEADDGPDDTEA